MSDVPLPVLPVGFRERLPRSFHPWLDQLPEMIVSYLDRWELTVVGEFPLSYSFVAPVERQDGRPCVLKIQATDVREVEGAERELLGLRLAGPVAVGVVEEDARNGALLLERVLPGTTLREMADRDDDVATETLATVIGSYGRPVDEPASLGLRPFEDFAEAFERFDRGPHGAVARRKEAAATESRLAASLALDEVGTTVPAIRAARETAERVLEELLLDPETPYLLHGDLHHGNVLLDEERGPLVIDPWGLYGDRTTEVATALHNPTALVSREPDVQSLIRRRLSIYSGILDLDEERLFAWSYVYNVIGVLWTLEDDGAVSQDHPGLRTVAALRQLI